MIYATLPQHCTSLPVDIPIELGYDEKNILYNDNTEFLSFLMRERDRTVTVFDYSFQSVTAFRLERS
jgi:hypothetical protein